MRAVLDSNIFVSAFAFPGGRGEEAIAKIARGEVELVISKPIIHETLDVLVRKFDRTPEELAHVAVFLSDLGEVVTPRTKIKVLDDEPDNRIPGAPALSMARQDFPVPLAPFGHGALICLRLRLRQAATALRSSVALYGARHARPQWLHASRGSAIADYAPSLRSPWRAATGMRHHRPCRCHRDGRSGDARSRQLCWNPDDDAAGISEEQLIATRKILDRFIFRRRCPASIRQSRIDVLHVIVGIDGLQERLDVRTRGIVQRHRVFRPVAQLGDRPR